MLPPEVIATDHQLEEIADNAGGQLARHRWHWTLDENNLQRVSIREYARQSGRAFSVIHKMANGYARWLISQEISLEEHTARAAMSAETETVSAAVGQARGMSAKTARDNRPQEVRRVREISRQLAEERGTSVEQEAPKVAETIARAEQAAKATEAERREHTDLRFFEMERYLISAKRELLRAVKLAPQVSWDDEHRELLSDTLGNVKSLLGLLDAAIAGISGTDWDAEFAKLGEQS